MKDWLNRLYKKLHWLYKITRPVVVIAGMLGTWVIAISSNGPDIFSINKIAAAASMGFSCLGSSVCHFGIAHKIYKAKWYDPVPIKRPYLYVSSGLCFFGISVLISLILPARCTCVAISIPLAIVLYGKFLSKHWITKNLVIAAVCTTPILMGWWAGHHRPEILPYAAGTVFFAYIAREAILDIRDIKANRGERVTLPIRFSVKNAMRVAGYSLIISIYFCLLLFDKNTGKVLSSALIGSVILLLGGTAAILLRKTTPGNSQKFITIAVYCLIIAVLITGI